MVRAWYLAEFGEGVDPKLEHQTDPPNYVDPLDLCRITGIEYINNKCFHGEHYHPYKETRLVLEGAGYFDVRDPDDRAIRIEAVKGDLLVFPAGIYHRFMTTDKDYIVVKRYRVEDHLLLFCTRPISAADEKNFRKAYLERLQGDKSVSPQQLARRK